MDPTLKDYLGMNILAFNLNISCFQTLFNFFPSKLSTKFIKEQFSIPSSFSSHRGQLKRVSLIMEGNTQTMPDKENRAVTLSFEVDLMSTPFFS